ncbi:SPX domain-containing protein [Zychaea mexicana]|uniref:SPX domain-containing protein n=1 Tax=Zychaea mexicana TaxID=64656 RepID=UPI0022FDD49A|nr:SPX domain-containing protein [Zychaea mexicana]KAI9487972.1 SPX domain-containing protein [Zychaea mexicana]
MKFAHTLILNAVPDWVDQYVDYDHLKKLAYRIERINVQQMLDRRPSMAQLHENDDDQRFIAECNKQLDKVCKFYSSKEVEVFNDAKTLRSQFDEHHTTSETPTVSRVPSSNSNYENANNGLARWKTVAGPPSLSSRDNNPNRFRGLQFLRRPNSNLALNRRVTEVQEFNRYYNFRARCSSIYILLSELKSYINLNHEAFQKITKKWDKITGSNLRTTYCKEIVDVAHPFQQSRLQEIDTAMKLIEQMYAAVFTEGDITSAIGELKLHMRDHIHYERNTVWKDMVGKERETFDAHAVQYKPGFNIPIIKVFCSRMTVRRICTLLLSVVMYACLMSFDTLESEAASKCLALLIFVAMLWAFETLPLFATAYLIPLLIVPMDIIHQEDGNGLMSAKDAAKAVFASMFNGTIAVLLGGFAIAAALSRHGITKAFAAVVLSKAGTKPHWVILVNMYLAAFLCMWISNVATPVLCFSLVQPILRTLPPNSKVGPCLIMGIALASCIGGLSSPISSPQNIIAIQLLDPNPGWGIWFAASIPLTIICILTTWGMLLLYFRPTRSTPRINAIKNQGYARPSYSQVWVVLVCLVTIGLWCGETAMQDFWGDNGVIALIPFVLLFGTNMLNKTDLNNFLWSVVTLAQGGMALGFAVDSSGLLDIIGHRIANGVQEMPVLAILFIFGILVLVFATFVSHTVAALIILPIVKQVGQHLPAPHPNLLVMGTGLTASVAMGLPVSGFPNMNAIMQEDSTGKPYLHMKDFVLCGLPSSIIAALITILLGYGILGGVGY